MSNREQTSQWPPQPEVQHRDIFAELGELPECFYQRGHDHSFIRHASSSTVTLICQCGQEWEIRRKRRRDYVVKNGVVSG